MSRREEQDEAEMVEIVAKSIRSRAAITTYDHRPALLPEVREHFPHLLDDHQLLFVRIKCAIAHVIRPARVLEIGVGWGCSARAFFAGHPPLHYFGVDNREMGLNPIHVMTHPDSPGAVELAVLDSDALPRFRMPDGSSPVLVHLDGSHERGHKTRDVLKAMTSGADWLVLDDAHDPMVAAGIFDGFLQGWKGSIPMAYFENSHSGSLLVFIGGYNQRKDW